MGEPGVPPCSVRCSDQLSYGPARAKRNAERSCLTTIGRPSRASLGGRLTATEPIASNGERARSSNDGV
jgi:hypothetical protein